MSFNPLDLYLMGLMPRVRKCRSVGGDRQQLWRQLGDALRRPPVDQWLHAIDRQRCDRGQRHSLARLHIIAAHLPGGDGGGVRRPAVGRCDGVHNYFAQRMEARERLPIHEGFSKQLSAPFFVATGGRGALIATVDTAVVVPTRLTVVEYFHAGLNYYFMTSRDNERRCWMAFRPGRARA